MAAYNEEQVQIATVFSDLHRIGEACDGLYSMADFQDAVTFDHESQPRTGLVFNYQMAYAQALQRPSATACAYITEMHLRMIRAASRAFCMLNPYWKGVRKNKIAYIIGTGHVWSVVPRRKGKKVPEELVWKVQGELEQFHTLNQFRRVQGERITRLDRDGEYFLRFFTDADDGVLRVRFEEPLMLQDPPGTGPEGGVIFGIGFDPPNYVDPVRYYFKAADYLGNMTSDMDAAWRKGVPAADLQRRTVNVDIGSPRGLPSTYDLQEALTQAVSTRKSMGRLVDIRARIAMIRKQVNATLGQIQPLLLRNRSGTVQQGNQLRNAFGVPYGSIWDTNDQRSYEFPSQNIETDKIVHSLKADLQSVASAMGLADFCISADASSAFANALIKEGPMDRCMGVEQQDMIDDDTAVYERALQHAADQGRLPGDVLETIRVDITPPGVIARERLTQTQADQILWTCGAISSDTMAMRANLDPQDEKEKGAKAMVQSGDTNPAQAGKGRSTTRGVPAGKEPGPEANKNATKEELEEHASDMRAQDKPTQEDYAMAAVLLTPEWCAQTKAEILGLPRTERPLNPAAMSEYEPGVRGSRLGIVDGQEVWSVDFDAMMVKHQAPDLITAGNHMRWPFIPADKIVVDWSFSAIDKAYDLWHEVVETRLMAVGKWAYGRAHKLANVYEHELLLELRPELAALEAA